MYANAIVHFRRFSAERITVAQQHPDTTPEVAEFHQQQLETDSNRVHEHSIAGIGTGIRFQHVPIASPSNRDRHESEIVRETGEDLVPKSQGEIQEGGSTRGTESEVLLLEDVRQEEGRLRGRFVEQKMRSGGGEIDEEGENGCDREDR